VELAKACDYLLRKYGKSIAGRQHALKRVADMTIDLFVGLCTLSRATALAADKGEESTQAMVIAHIFARQAKRRLAHNVRRIERNEDEQLEHLAGFIVDRGRYPWDIAQ
jgi:alkylation response protein AidB-like acyl-CoA dehydrogenase